MKKLAVLFLILLLLVPPTAAQEPTEHKTHLPIVVANSCGEKPTMSDWKVIAAESTVNTVVNPSAEIAGNFAAEAGTTVTRVTTYSKWGLYSYRVQCNADNEGIRLTTAALANAVHYATVRVRGTLPPNWDFSMDNANWHMPTLIESLDADWSLYGVQLPAAQCNGQTTFRIHQDGGGSGDFYLDGVQIEELEYWTTYTDGDQEGCEWNGAEHASISTRSAQSRAGGRVRDLQDDYSFDVGGMTGAGMAPLTLAAHEYAVLPGGEVSGAKTHMHPFALTGVIRGTSYADLHAKRQALVLLFDPDGVPEDEDGPQPVRLRYTGAAVQKEIAVHYEAGLEGRINATDPCWWERVAIRVLADDPFWHEIGESAVVLDSNDTVTLRYCAGRLKSTGQWDDLGLTANPTGGAGSIRAICVASDGLIYYGGDFTGMDNQAGRDYIASYDPATDTWATVGGASDFNGVVYDIIEGPDGTIYACGAFTDCAADPNADHIAQWDGANWSAVGQPIQGGAAITNVYEMAFDSGGDLYIVGNFTDWANIGNADYVVMWDGTNYNAVGQPVQGAAAITDVQTVAIDSQDNVYVGGSFLNFADDGNADHWAVWDGTAWSAVGDIALNSPVYKIVIDRRNFVYVGGNFTNAANIDNADYIFRWTGTAAEALSTGVDGSVYGLHVAPDELLYVSGSFTRAGTITLPILCGLARWNGSSWTHVDLNAPVGIGVVTVKTGRVDPVVPTNYDVWIGFDQSGVSYFAGSVTATNDGTESAYPVIVVERSGGTSAVIETLRNETTGKELLFDYSLLDGERLTIDLTPTEKSIVSNFFGSRLDAILAGCDFGTFALQPSDNQVTAFVNVVGGPTVTAYLLWVDRYDGYD